LCDGLDIVAADTIWVFGIICVGDELLPFTVQFIQTTVVGCNPEVVVLIDEEVVDLTVVQTRGIGGIVLEAGYFSGYGIVAVDPRAVGAYPYDALLILDQAADEIAAYTGGIFGIVTEGGELISVEAVESVLGSEPHESLAVLQDVVYDALGKSLVKGVAFEADII